MMCACPKTTTGEFCEIDLCSDIVCPLRSTCMKANFDLGGNVDEKIVCAKNTEGIIRPIGYQSLSKNAQIDCVVDKEELFCAPKKFQIENCYLELYTVCILRKTQKSLRK